MPRVEKQDLVKLANTTLGPFTPEYKIEDYIGRGSFATVWKARHKATGRAVALKALEKKDQVTSSLARDEKEIWFKLKNHKNIVKLYDVIDCPNYCIFISEYEEEGECLESLITSKALSLDEKNEIFSQIVNGIAYIHKMGYAHGDLKPSNILWNRKERIVKILDFGLSMSTSAFSSKFYGSPNYAAPEVHCHTPFLPAHADVWSLGVLSFVIMVGYLPFQFVPEGPSFVAKIDRAMMRAMLVRNGIQRDHYQLILDMITIDPNSRPSLTDVQRSINKSPVNLEKKDESTEGKEKKQKEKEKRRKRHSLSVTLSQINRLTKILSVF